MSDEGSGFSLDVPLNGAPPGPTAPAGPIFKKRGRPRKAPGEGTTRRDHDAYDTPPELARACVSWCRGHLTIPGDHLERVAPLILDPTAGNGPFAAAAREVWPSSRVVAVDIRDVCRAACEASGAIFACTDALTLDPKTIGRADLIITNPPFKLADDLVRHLWGHMKDWANLALLLPVTFPRLF